MTNDLTARSEMKRPLLIVVLKDGDEAELVVVQFENRLKVNVETVQRSVQFFWQSG